MKKIKFLPSVLMLIACLAMLGIGVYALGVAKNNVKGIITVLPGNPEISIAAYYESVDDKNLIGTSQTTRTGVDIDITDSRLTFDTADATSMENLGTKNVVFQVTNNSKKDLGVFFATSNTTASTSATADLALDGVTEDGTTINNVIKVSFSPYTKLVGNGTITMTMSFKLLKYVDENCTIDLSNYTIYLNTESPVMDAAQITDMRYVGDAYYPVAEVGSEPELKFAIDFIDATSVTAEITEDLYVVDGEFTKPNFQEPGLYKCKISYFGRELEFMVRVVYAEEVTSVAYTGKTLFAVGEDHTMYATVTFADSTVKEIEVGDDMYYVDETYLKPDFNTSATYRVKFQYKGVSSNEVKIIVLDESEVLLSNSDFVYGSNYDVNKGDGVNIITSGEYSKGKTHTESLRNQDIVVRVSNVTQNLSLYKVELGYFNAEGKYTGRRGSWMEMNNGELYIPASSIGSTLFKVTVFIYSPFIKVPESVAITVYKVPEIAKGYNEEDYILTTDDFVKGTRYESSTIRTDGSHGSCRTSAELIDKQDIIITVKTTDIANYKTIITFFDDSNGKKGQETYAFNNGVVEIMASTIHPSATKIGITILNWPGGSSFLKVPETCTILVEKKITYTDWQGKTISIVGDSISAGGYPNSLGNLTGAAIDNNAVSGTKLSGDGGLVAQLANIDKDADLIIVFGGTNDYWHKGTRIGTSADTTTATFYGALKHILNYLQTNHSTAKYLFVFPYDQTFSGSASSTDFGYGSLDDFRTAFIEFCTTNGLSYLDMGATEFDCAIHTGDGVHPNAAGVGVISSAIYKKITENF